MASLLHLAYTGMILDWRWKWGGKNKGNKWGKTRYPALNPHPIVSHTQNFGKRISDITQSSQTIKYMHIAEC